MVSGDEIRDAQRAVWDGLAAGWATWDAVIQRQLAPVGLAMIESIGMVAGQQHLDIASGTGEPGLTIAALDPSGQVVLTDISPEMLRIAERRAATLGLAHVDICVCSADDLPFDDATFDSISVRFGYMFLPDLAAATAEFARVLRPGGRLAAAVWVRPQDNPWTSIVMSAIAAEVPLPPVEPDRPSMFRCAADGQVAGLYADAGLRDVAERDVAVELVTRSTQEYWAVMSEHVSLAVAALQQVDDAARVRIGTAVTAAAARYERDGEVRVPGMARCIVGTK